MASQEVAASCPLPFDEAQLWQGEDAAELRKQLQASFHNITAVMDCVGCEKCKLWGKLQLLGAPQSASRALLWLCTSQHVLQPSFLPAGQQWMLLQA